MNGCFVTAAGSFVNETSRRSIRNCDVTHTQSSTSERIDVNLHYSNIRSINSFSIARIKNERKTFLKSDFKLIRVSRILRYVINHCRRVPSCSFTHHQNSRGRSRPVICMPALIHSSNTMISFSFSVRFPILQFLSRTARGKIVK